MSTGETLDRERLSLRTAAKFGFIYPVGGGPDDKDLVPQPHTWPDVLEGAVQEQTGARGDKYYSGWVRFKKVKRPSALVKISPHVTWLKQKGSRLANTKAFVNPAMRTGHAAVFRDRSAVQRTRETSQIVRDARVRLKRAQALLGKVQGDLVDALKICRMIAQGGKNNAAGVRLLTMLQDTCANVGKTLALAETRSTLADAREANIE